MVPHLSVVAIQSENDRQSGQVNASEDVLRCPDVLAEVGHMAERAEYPYMSCRVACEARDQQSVDSLSLHLGGGTRKMAGQATYTNGPVSP